MLTRIDAGWAFLLFMLGIAFIALEVFVIPGFGIAGILGIVLMLGSVFFVFDGAYNLRTAVLWLSISVIFDFWIDYSRRVFLTRNTPFPKVCFGNRDGH